MRRFVTLAVLLLFSIPFGISITGCHHATVVVYCNGGDSGPVVGQIANIVLQPALTGVSLNEGEIGQVGSAVGSDCKGNPVNATFTYSSSNTNIVDVQPSSGHLCAGNWNRNTGPVPDYTVCNPTNIAGTAYITADSGATSNPVPVYVHPIVTSVVLGTPSTNCATDPATNCSPAAVTAASSSTTPPSCTILSNGCCSVPVTATVPGYTGGCLSQATTAQLAARVFAGTGSSQSNISCEAGHLTFTPQTPAIVNIDENGIATAEQPGSSLISALVSQASSSAGFFSTCPPATITLSIPGTGAADPTNVLINQNNPQPAVAVVKDVHGTTISGLALEYNSTTPTTIPPTGGIVTPVFPGAAAITAVCQPPTCNPAPFGEIGLQGNGTPITSNPVHVTTPGTNSTILYIASTQSRDIVLVDFTMTTLGTPVQLPYIPNSMVLSEDQTTLYLGTPTEIMIFSATLDQLTTEDQRVSGIVLSVSPDNKTVVINDQVRKIIYLYSPASGAGSSSSILTTYGGVATSAQWSPDSQTVYITAGTQLLIYSTFTGWTANTLTVTSPDAAVTVPSVGAYLSGATTTGISYCPSTTVGTGNPPPTTNVFYPVADQSAATTDQLTATNDGLHILGASVAGPNFSDLRVTLPTTTACPLTVSPGYFQSTYTTYPLAGVTPSSITGVSAASDSSVAFVTYTGTGGVLPAYVPASTGIGTLTNIPLLINNSPAGPTVAPVAGVFSTDNSTFYVGTSGDNQVHIISKSQMKDIGTLAPKLPNASGTLVAPNLLAQRPRPTP